MPSFIPTAGGRPRDPALGDRILRAVQDVLIERGFERLTLEEVALRARSSKASIHRRWPTKEGLMLAAVVGLYRPPPVPDTGDLRQDLVSCARAFLPPDDRAPLVLARLIAASIGNDELQRAAFEAVARPYQQMFERVLERAVDRGTARPDADVPMLARVFPALAFQQVAALGEVIDESLIERIVDGVLLPSLGRGDLRPAISHESTPRSL